MLEPDSEPSRPDLVSNKNGIVYSAKASWMDIWLADRQARFLVGWLAVFLARLTGLLTFWLACWQAGVSGRLDSSLVGRLE